MFENTEPTDPLELLKEDICDDSVFLLSPESSSGLRSDDEDDGARVAIVDPTG